MRLPCLRALFAILLLEPAAATAVPDAAATRCPPPGFDRAGLLALRERKFVVDDDARRQGLAHALLACLSDPDSELRDRIGYEAYSYWRRARALDAATWSDVVATLEQRLGDAPDAAGVAAPFAALVLADAVHADRDRPYLDAARRGALLDATTGWRHGVAHGADLLGELVLEPEFGTAQFARILDALATQVAAHDGHVYAFGESERIAAAAARTARRSAVTTADWKRFIDGVTAPAPFARWADAWADIGGLAKRQNTMNFLLALYAELEPSPDAVAHERAAIVATAMQPLR
jgi:uncharacterized protein DUF2785